MDMLYHESRQERAFIYDTGTCGSKWLNLSYPILFM